MANLDTAPKSVKNVQEAANVPEVDKSSLRKAVHNVLKNIRRKEPQTKSGGVAGARG